jgi:hypothetical protein
LKPSSLSLPAASIALLTAAVVAVTTVAQNPQTQTPPPPNAESHHDHHHPAPTNLKVLPKNLTGEQVHEIMEGWAAALGTHCNTCHAPDPTKIGPNGRPELNFADDSKPEKATARLMFRMVEDINGNYVSKIESSGDPVACGTCHRGHLTPEPFLPPPDDHDGPRPAQAPPAGSTPPPPR